MPLKFKIATKQLEAVDPLAARLGMTYSGSPMARKASEAKAAAEMAARIRQLDAAITSARTSEALTRIKTELNNIIMRMNVGLGDGSLTLDECRNLLGQIETTLRDPSTPEELKSKLPEFDAKAQSLLRKFSGKHGYEQATAELRKPLEPTDSTSGYRPATDWATLNRAYEQILRTYVGFTAQRGPGTLSFRLEEAETPTTPAATTRTARTRSEINASHITATLGGTLPPAIFNDFKKKEDINFLLSLVQKRLDGFKSATGQEPKVKPKLQDALGYNRTFLSRSRTRRATTTMTPVEPTGPAAPATPAPSPTAHTTAPPPPPTNAPPTGAPTTASAPPAPTTPAPISSSTATHSAIAANASFVLVEAPQIWRNFFNGNGGRNRGNINALKQAFADANIDVEVDKVRNMGIVKYKEQVYGFPLTIGYYPIIDYFIAAEGSSPFAAITDVIRPAVLNPSNLEVKIPGEVNVETRTPSAPVRESKSRISFMTKWKQFLLKED